MTFHPANIQLIRKEVAEFTERKRKAGKMGVPYGLPEYDLLQTHPVGYFMDQEYGTPMPRMLFGSFWFEHELCILFADTNLGKSVLAVQIADSLTKAFSIEPFYNMVDQCARVLYIDFELSAKQFQMRYFHREWGSHPFSEQFFRSQFNPAGDDPVIYGNDYEGHVSSAIESAVRSCEANVLIIDNITYMCRGTEKAGDAMPLMKVLKALKTNHRLSVLVLAHTPKRNPCKPLTVNDLQGSKMLINFADSAFAIGQSFTDKNLRYLKQIKQRSAREEYGEDRVCLITQEKKGTMLQYRFLGHDHEQNHIIRPTRAQRALQIEKVNALHREGLSNRQIAARLGIHHSTVATMLQASPGAPEAGPPAENQETPES